MSFNYSQASKLVEHALLQAKENEQIIAVAVCDAYGELVCFGRCDGISPQANLLAQNKAYTAARDRQPSGNLGKWARETGKDMGYWTDARITGIAGGRPITINDQVVGAIGISGLAEFDDEALAASTVKEILGTD